MALDASTLSALAYELNNALSGGRLDKVYQMSKSEALLTVRSLGTNYKLLLSCDASKGRVCLTEQTYENPDKPPVFCMLMRKHLSGGKILNIETIKNERIVKIEVENTNELFELTKRILYIEIMGKHSNIILTDENNRILDSIRHIDFTISEKRQVLPGFYYEYPPAQDKFDPTVMPLTEISEILSKSPKNVEQTLVENFLGISPILAREIEASNGSKAEILLDYLDKSTKHEYNPVILLDKSKNNLPKFLYIFDLAQYGDFYEKKYFDTVNECVDTFYRTQETKRRIDEKKEALDKVISSHVSRITKKIDIHNKNIKKAEKKDKYRVYAELITTNLYRLKENAQEVILENYYDENREMAIPMDETMSPSRNAKKYFEKYNKEKNMEKMSAKLIDELMVELSYLNSVKDLLDISDDPKIVAEIREELIENKYISEPQTKKKKIQQSVSKPLEFTSSDGFLILCGRNNRQNDELTLKIAHKNDTWLHIRDIPGCHTIIRCDGNPVPDVTLHEAALIAAHYSKDKNNTKASVDYTNVRYVKKPSGSKPGMVIYDNFKTVIVEPNTEKVESLRKV